MKTHLNVLASGLASVNTIAIALLSPVAAFAQEAPQTTAKTAQPKRPNLGNRGNRIASAPRDRLRDHRPAVSLARNSSSSPAQPTSPTSSPAYPLVGSSTSARPVGDRAGHRYHRSRLLNLRNLGVDPSTPRAG